MEDRHLMAKTSEPRKDELAFVFLRRFIIEMYFLMKGMQ